MDQRQPAVAHRDGGPAFESGELVPGARFAWAAGPPGTYPYHCTIHPEMTGELEIRRVTLVRRRPRPSSPARTSS